MVEYVPSSSLSNKVFEQTNLRGRIRDCVAVLNAMPIGSFNRPLYWPAEFARQQSYKDEATNVDMSCHVTVGTPNQVDCLKAAYNFQRAVHTDGYTKSRSSPPRFSINGMGSPSGTIQQQGEYALMNVLR